MYYTIGHLVLQYYMYDGTPHIDVHLGVAHMGCRRHTAGHPQKGIYTWGVPSYM